MNASTQAELEELRRMVWQLRDTLAALRTGQPNPQTAAEKWVRTVPLDCPHPLEAREVHVCYKCAAANLDAYARQQVEAALEGR